MAHQAARRPRRSRYVEAASLLVLIAFAAWIAYSFAQEAYIDHRLAQERAARAAQNAQIQAQNDAYQRDIAAVMSGADAEESARRDGYARLSEKVYVVAPPPADASPAKAVVKVDDSQGDLWGGITHWLSQHLHL